MVRRQDRRLRELEQLYRADFPRFLHVARAIIGDRERALEATQDAFVGLVKNRDAFRGEGPLEAWAWRSVVNAAKNATRRPLVEVGRINEEPVYVVPETVAELAPLIAALPERQRHAVFLRYYADLDYRAISIALDIEVGTVSATLAAAHAGLRKKIGKVETDV
jgi:RNA polymerase sigma-70 factor (ECF subfamily)